MSTKLFSISNTVSLAYRCGRHIEKLDFIRVTFSPFIYVADLTRVYKIKCAHSVVSIVHITVNVILDGTLSPSPKPVKKLCLVSAILMRELIYLIKFMHLTFLLVDLVEKNIRLSQVSSVD